MEKRRPEYLLNNIKVAFGDSAGLNRTFKFEAGR